MAEKLTAKPKTGLDRSALKRAVSEINKAKEKAAEYGGSAGAATKNACETYNLDKKALTFVCGLARKEPAQQLQTLSAIVTYAEALGMFAHMDMFNDAAAAMKAILDEATAGQGPAKAPGASTIAGLTSVQ